MAQDQRLKKLAQRIEALRQKDEQLVERAREIAGIRQKAAAELHLVCANFVKAVNGLLPRPVLELGPEEYAPETFRDSGVNLFQINARGRLVQIAFQATQQLVSTEEFRISYVLEGEVRTFNQDMLERGAIESQRLFYCLEKDKNRWRFFERGTYRTGLFDSDFLIAVMEGLL